MFVRRELSSANCPSSVAAECLHQGLLALTARSCCVRFSALCHMIGMSRTSSLTTTPMDILLPALHTCPTGNLVAAATPSPTPALVSPFLSQQPSTSLQGSSSFPEELPAPSPAPIGEKAACSSAPSPVRSLDINLPIGGIPAHKPVAKLALAKYMGEWDSTMSAAGSGAAPAISESGASSSPFRQGPRGSTRSQHTSEAGQGADFGAAGSASGFGSSSLGGVVGGGGGRSTGGGRDSSAWGDMHDSLNVPGGSFWGGNSYTSTIPDMDDSPAAGPPTVTHVDSMQSVVGGGGGSSGGFGSRGVIGIATGGGGGGAETSPGAGGSQGDVSGSGLPAVKSRSSVTLSRLSPLPEGDHSSTPGPSVANSAANSVAHSAANSVTNSAANSVPNSAGNSVANSAGNSDDEGAGQQLHARSRTCNTPGCISADVGGLVFNPLVRRATNPASRKDRSQLPPLYPPTQQPYTPPRSAAAAVEEGRTPGSAASVAIPPPGQRSCDGSYMTGSEQPSQTFPAAPAAPRLPLSPTPTPISTPARAYGEGAKWHERSSSSHSASSPTGPLLASPSLFSHGASPSSLSSDASQPLGRRPTSTPAGATEPPASLPAQTSFDSSQADMPFPAHTSSGSRQLGPAESTDDPSVGQTLLDAGEPGYRYPVHPASRCGSPPQPYLQAHDHTSSTPPRLASTVTAFDNMLYAPSNTADASSSGTAHTAPHSATQPASVQPPTHATAPPHPSYTSGNMSDNSFTPNPPNQTSSSDSAPSSRPTAASSHFTPAPFVTLHVNDPPTGAQRELRFTACGNETYPSSSSLPHRASLPPGTVGMDQQAPTSTPEQTGSGSSTDPDPSTVARRHTLGQMLKEDMERTRKLAGAVSTASDGSGAAMDKDLAGIATRRSTSNPDGMTTAPAAAPFTVLPWPASYAEQLLRRGLGSLWGSQGGSRS